MIDILVTIQKPHVEEVKQTFRSASAGYSLSWWWIIRSTSANPFWAGFFVRGQSGQATSSWSEAPSDCFCWHFHRPLHDLTLPPHLA
jgi:hypothetical protein